MIVISGLMEIPTESIEEFKAISRELCTATRAEPGCAAYTFAQDLDDASVFQIFEEWADQQALDAHTVAGHYRTWGRTLKGINVRRMTIVRYDVGERVVMV